MAEKRFPGGMESKLLKTESQYIDFILFLFIFEA
jgi:hypothetical protein